MRGTVPDAGSAREDPRHRSGGRLLGVGIAVVAGQRRRVREGLAVEPLEHEARAVDLDDRGVLGCREDRRSRHDVMTAHRGVECMTRRRRGGVRSTGAEPMISSPPPSSWETGGEVRGAAAARNPHPRYLPARWPRPSGGQAGVTPGRAARSRRVRYGEDPTSAGGWRTPGREVSRERRTGRAGWRPRRREPTSEPGRWRSRWAEPRTGRRPPWR